jgi:hypothetical protein
MDLRMNCAGTIGKVSSEVCALPGGMFKYTYYVGNDASAFGNALWLRMNVQIDDHISHEAAPDGWRALPTIASWLTLDDEDSMAPGEIAGPFIIHSTRGPGLASFVVGGYSSILKWQEGCSLNDLMSALIEPGGPFSERNIHSVVLTIGPRLPCSLEAVQSHIGAAAARPEFSAIGDDLNRIRAYDVSSLGAGLAAIHPESPLQQQFIQSMLMNLERLPV